MMSSARSRTSRRCWLCTTGPSGSLLIISGSSMCSLALAKLAALRRQQRHIACQNRAAAGGVSLDEVFPALRGDELVTHFRAREIIRYRSFAGPAGQDANRGTGKFEHARHRMVARHHEALPVVKQNADEANAEFGVARQCPGRCAQQDVDLAFLQRLEASAACRARNLTASLLPNTAAASAEQNSTSSPLHCPWEFTWEKPGACSLTPQTM